MRKLSEHTIERIVSLLKEGKPLPDDYKSVLFENKREYELVYAGKERAEDILADTMAVPLQPVKTFQSDESSDDWTNMLIFGDNLQVLKTLLQMKHEGKLKNADGTPGVRLIYIDPPFATKQEFCGNRGQKAYQDKIAGSRFLEFLRKRLIFLRELLSDDGSIYVHLDHRKGHYIKVLMDEIFGEQNFRSEIIVRRAVKNHAYQFDKINALNIAYDTLLWYSKRADARFSAPTRPASEYQKQGRWCGFWIHMDRPTMRYELLGYTPEKGGWMWSRERAYRAVKNYETFLEESAKTGETLEQYWMRTGKKLEFVRRTGAAKPQYWVTPRDEVICDNNWLDILAYNYKGGYPTQKSEALLARIVKASSRPGDIVLDCFAGSGTTLTVAEKLGRRWISIDCGKLAIYTAQKRLLNIAKSADLENPENEYSKHPRSFTIYNAGLYDYKMIKELPWEQYREFALKLFQCRDKQHEVSKIELDGYIGSDSVLVFNYQKHKNAVLDRGFIDDLHKYIGNKIGKRFFIIAPAASVAFLEDYIEKGKTKYFILRIPYSIIEEIYNRGFTRIRQPVSEMDVNDTIEAVGFDFIQVPAVECKYARDAHECVIKIDKFESNVISRKPLKFDNLETLSMVMLDYDFNGEIFNLDEVFYAEDLKSNGYEIRFAKNKVKGQIMIIYVDIFGNEKREVKTLADFNGERD